MLPLAQLKTAQVFPLDIIRSVSPDFPIEPDNKPTRCRTEVPTGFFLQKPEINNEASCVFTTSRAANANAN